MSNPIGCNAHHIYRQVGTDHICFYCNNVKEKEKSWLQKEEETFITNFQDAYQMAWMKIHSILRDKYKKTKPSDIIPKT